MKQELIRANLRKPASRFDVIKKICQGKVVLDIGCVNHSISNITMDNWLHGAISKVAKRVVGVDYLDDAVRELTSMGYEVILADATKSIPIDEKFDVIVVSNLIEHLSGFEGLLLNINNLLKEDGVALISTANPFYIEQYFYSAFKNDIIVNGEHTCWIDPVTLEQLVLRFGLSTNEIFWIQDRWSLDEVIFNSKSRVFDVYTGKWDFDNNCSVSEKIISSAIGILLRLFKPKKAQKALLKYGSKKMHRMLYLHFLRAVFKICWNLYKKLIITSPINNYELFISILKKV